MNFLIHGVHFHNKGAELMLHAVKQQLHEWDRNNSLSLAIRVGSFSQRKKAGVNHLMRRPTKKIPIADPGLRLIASMIPKNIRKTYKVTLESEIEVILDASGFYFGDQWGAETTEKAVETFSQWKKNGKKIILLPQAFGSFTSNRIQQSFAQLIDNVDLAFARDAISYEYVSQLPILIDRVKVAPDFTNLVRGINPPYINDLVGRPCIIPNCRMIDRTSSDISSKYLSFLIASIEYLSEKGLKPFILIHETFDYNLAVQLQSQSHTRLKVPIIKDDNPLHLKSILGRCSLVIGSRFHGLVSALSQGIPCLGTAWSHKYKMLFRDYNSSELLIDFDDHLQDNLGKLDSVIYEPTRSRIIKDVNQAAESQKVLSKQMWSEVKKMLDMQRAT